MLGDVGLFWLMVCVVGATSEIHKLHLHLHASTPSSWGEPYFLKLLVKKSKPTLSPHDKNLLAIKALVLLILYEVID